MVQMTCLAERLAAMGYEVTDVSSESACGYRGHLDADDHDFIKAGGKGLLLAETPSCRIRIQRVPFYSS